MCHRQLAEYQERISDFTERQVKLVTASVDGLDDARRFRDKQNLSFDVGYGLDGKAVAELTGGFYDKAKGFLHASSFVLDVEDKVAVSVYSTGAVGRLVPGDALTIIDYLRKARG